MNDSQREIAEQVRAMIPRLVDKRVSAIRENLIAEVLRRIDFESLSDDVLEVTSKRISVFGGSSLIPRINADTVDFLPSGTGAVARTVQAKERDIVSVKDFGATGDGITDDTTNIQAALDYATQNNLKLIFPKGIYLVSTGLTMTGISASNYGKIVQLESVGNAPDGNTVCIKWNGTSNAANTLIKVNGLLKLICRGISFYGNGKVGKVFWATQNVGTSFSPSSWKFEDCNFEAALSGGSGFNIDTATNMARFSFIGCAFSAGSGNTGLNIANANSVSHSLINCSFNSNDYGIHINGGAFHAFGCEFSLNALADVYIQICNPCSMYGCWTEQSRQFILTDSRVDNAPLTLVDCNIASFPWEYWKQGPEGSRPQPTNNSTQWAAISWDGDRGALNLIGCVMTDPNNGAAIGVVAPTTASTILVDRPSGVGTSEPRFNFVGSLSQNGANTYTEQFLNIGTNQAAAPRLMSRKKVTIYGSLSGSFSINTFLDSTSVLTLGGNITATLTTANSLAGDRYAVDATQDGSGNHTLGFVNAKTAGTFVPTVTAGARSRIEFEFDGTNWIEVTRSLNLA